VVLFFDEPKNGWEERAFWNFGLRNFEISLPIISGQIPKYYYGKKSREYF
jgi:hypothetical protein